MLDDIGILLISNNRSRAYLQRMLFANLVPACALVLTNPDDQALPGQKKVDLNGSSEPSLSSEHTIAAGDEFKLDENISVLQSLESGNIPFEKIPSANPNDDIVQEKLSSLAPKTWIYSGPGGAILGKKLLRSGKRFLHVHPGIVPQYRGSTTLYYSLLNESSCGASAIFLSEDIDEGGVIATANFEPPADRREIDYLFDPLVRSELLVSVLADYAQSGEFPCCPQTETARLYYIIHPVLKHLAILSDSPPE